MTDLNTLSYTAKFYVMNQNRNQSDTDLYPEMQQNIILATGVTLNSKSVCISSTKSALRHALFILF